MLKAPGLKFYRDPDGTFHGAYGNRIGRQLDDVVHKLRDDPLTRQAVITLWNPDLDNEPGHLDYPCTLAIGFSLHGFANDRLHMHVQMRSNDVWLGLPYDMFQFGQLQYTIANILGVYPGRYTHSAWSMHLYEANLAESYNVVEPSKISIDAIRELQPEGLGYGYQPPKAVRKRAEDIALRPDELKDVTSDELWYVEALRD